MCDLFYLEKSVNFCKYNRKYKTTQTKSNILISKICNRYKCVMPSCEGSFHACNILKKYELKYYTEGITPLSNVRVFVVLY